MKNNFILIFSLFFFAISCNKKNEDSPSYNKGELTILTDDSFKSVTEALADGYMINYPETKITVQTKKEDLGFLDLLDQKAKIIVMSRDLSAEEKLEYKKRTDLDFLPAKFAADGVVFIVPKTSSKTAITIDEIKTGLFSENKTFIFDGTNSSNLNFVAQYFHKKPSELKFSIINGNKNLIEELNKYPDKIGVVGFNSISRPYDENSEKLRSLIKILPVEKNGITYDLSSDNLSKMQYPFTRVLYFLANEGGFNLASGFIRFSCTQIGQKIVEKEGLQPYNLYKREVQMR